MAIEREPSTRGRPRDPTIEPTVLDATRLLLSERGFAATTVQEISRRSGVHPPAIYRRWPTRLALIEDAAFSTLTSIDFPPVGDLRAGGIYTLAILPPGGEPRASPPDDRRLAAGENVVLSGSAVRLAEFRPD